MPISELGYRHWEGKRTSVLRRCLAITRSETGIAYRSSKLLRRFVFFAWVPILYFCPFFLAIGYVADPANDLREGTILTELAGEMLGRQEIARLRENPETFLPAIWSVAFYFFFAYTQSFFSMIVVAIVGPPLIAKDLKSKAFLVYFSKPIQPWQYLLGKLATIVFFVSSMTLFPAMLLYAVSIALSPDAGTLMATFPIVLGIVMTSVCIAVPIAMVVLLISSLTTDRRNATFAWVALWIFGEVAFRLLTLGENIASGFTPPPWASLLSLRQLATTAASGIFEVSQNLGILSTQLATPQGRLRHTLLDITADLGDPRMEVSWEPSQAVETASSYPPLVSIAVLAAITIVCALWVLRRAKLQTRI